MANFGMISVLTVVPNIFHAASYAENIQYIACGEYMQSLFIGFVPHAWECVGGISVLECQWRVRPTCVGMCRNLRRPVSPHQRSSHMRGNVSAADKLCNSK